MLDTKQLTVQELIILHAALRSYDRTHQQGPIYGHDVASLRKAVHAEWKARSNDDV
jgi:hypothetical protein